MIVMDDDERRRRGSISCKKYRERNIEKVKIYKKEYYMEHREEEKASQRRRHRDMRLKVLMIVGRDVIRCSNCGCDVVGLLEVNHKNGGGCKEISAYPYKFYRNIISGVRKTDDLNLLCSVCNRVYLAKLKCGANYNIKYLGREGKEGTGRKP